MKKERARIVAYLRSLAHWLETEHPFALTEQGRHIREMQATCLGVAAGIIESGKYVEDLERAAEAGR